MKKLVVLFLFLLSGQALAQTPEPPSFSISGKVGMDQVSGFLNEGYISNPAPGAGLWLGISLGDQWDGLFGMDFYSMPNLPVTVTLTPSMDNGYATFEIVQPTDDIALSVNVRWYLDEKYDRIHQHFNTVPYLLVGGGMDLLVDQYPPIPNSNFYSNSFDILFGMNAGAGIDFPLGDGKQWFIFAEGLDHLIAWQGLTQIYSGRVGIKVMLDAAHVDPFRGVF
jgi:hypothetical protein